MDSLNRASYRPAPATFRALIVSAAWLHLGLVGATTLAAGLLELTSGASGAAWGLVLVLAGAALAVTGWRRGLVALERIDPSTDIVTHAPRGSEAATTARQPSAAGGRVVRVRAPVEHEA